MNLAHNITQYIAPCTDFAIATIKISIKQNHYIFATAGITEEEWSSSNVKS